MPSSYEVAVEGLDLTAILENKEVISYSEIMETDKGPRTVHKKKLGEAAPPSTPEALEDCPCPEPCPEPDEDCCSDPHPSGGPTDHLAPASHEEEDPKE